MSFHVVQISIVYKFNKYQLVFCIPIFVFYLLNRVFKKFHGIIIHMDFYVITRRELAVFHKRAPRMTVITRISNEMLKYSNKVKKMITSTINIIVSAERNFCDAL